MGLLKAGQVAPLGFFDPVGLSAKIDEDKLLFYREAEVKNGRVCMVATLGIVVQEKFHTFFPNIDVPAAKLIEIQNKELNNGRLAMFAALGIIAQEMVTGKKIF